MVVVGCYENGAPPQLAHFTSAYLQYMSSSTQRKKERGEDCHNQAKKRRVQKCGPTRIIMSVLKQRYRPRVLTKLYLSTGLSRHRLCHAPLLLSTKRAGTNPTNRRIPSVHLTHFLLASAVQGSCCPSTFAISAHSNLQESAYRVPPSSVEPRLASSLSLHDSASEPAALRFQQREWLGPHLGMS